jgi:hypothetical protein
MKGKGSLERAQTLTVYSDNGDDWFNPSSPTSNCATSANHPGAEHSVPFFTTETWC